MNRVELLKPENWQLLVSFKTEVLTEYLIQSYHHYPAEVFGIDYKQRLIIDNDIYNSHSDLEATRSYFVHDLIGQAKQAMDKVQADSMRCIKMSESMTKFEKDADRLSGLKNWFDFYGKVVALIGVPGRLNEACEVQARKILELKVEVVDEALAIIGQSKKPSGVLQERLDLLKLASRHADDVEIEKHAKKYQWLRRTLLLGENYTADDVLNEIKLIEKANPEQELKQLIESQKNNIDDAEKFIEKLGLSEEDLSVIELFQELIWFQTARLEWANEACAKAQPFLQEIAKIINVEYEDMIYMLPIEIISALEGDRIDISEINKRKAGYAMFTLDGKHVEIIADKELEDVKQKFSNQINSGEIKGITACKGYAKGRARLINDRSDLGILKNGEIMIARLTTPDYIIDMKKSAAIVTDLGGITSHAAIVSRELGIPCIVGTGNATKILKDGDLIEVDANQGTVKIID
jgi:phosphohistidine swiveling domain-containing protein